MVFQYRSNYNDLKFAILKRLQGYYDIFEYIIKK